MPFVIMKAMPHDCPQLRSFLHRDESPRDPDHVYLVDQLGLAQPFPLTPTEVSWLSLLDGRRPLADLPEQLHPWLATLDDALLLESPRFRSVVEAPVRPPRHIGCYEGDADALREQLRQLFTHPDGAGLPRPVKPDGSLCAALIPHIDYARGGRTYTHAFKEVVEKSAASLFVIIGTSHYSSHRFTLTRKNFETPLGIVPTDQDYIDKLTAQYGDGLFADEWLAHFPEHSIELEVVFLQYLYENVKPIRIVPLVVGSFHDCVLAGKAPSQAKDIGRMIDALRRLEKEAKEPICYLISGDLAHIGPKFDLSQQLNDGFLRHSCQQDQTLLRHAEAVATLGYFRLIAAETDERNICGLPPTFVTLEAVRPRRGKVLRYDRYVHPHGYESVSFASMSFYR